jgi:hypothetical protein
MRIIITRASAMDPIIPLVFGIVFLAVSLARSLWL